MAVNLAALRINDDPGETLCADAAAEIKRLREPALFTAGFLDGLAMRLDGWAKESRTGGWSTHQVEANTKAADDCRRAAANLRAALT
jgi:hypothetical protein